jgi:hypothetical protein
MTTKAKEKQRQEKGPINKYYKSTRNISWKEDIPGYITPREAITLSSEEKRDYSDHLRDQYSLYQIYHQLPE